MKIIICPKCESINSPQNSECEICGTALPLEPETESPPEVTCAELPASTGVATEQIVETGLYHEGKLFFALSGEQFTKMIGRPGGKEPEDIDLSGLPDFDIVSRNHAVIYRNAQGLFLRDVGSTNGTFVNGVQIEKGGRPVRLSDQDRISFGRGEKIILVLRLAHESLER